MTKVASSKLLFLLTWLFSTVTTSEELPLRKTTLANDRNHLVYHSQGNFTTAHHIYNTDKAQRFKSYGLLSASLYDPYHEDVPTLTTLSQFFKVYGNREEKKIQEALGVMKDVYGGGYMPKVSNFKGRASLFQSGGVLADYKPMLYRLAQYHEVPRETALNFSMSFLERHADKWTMRTHIKYRNTNSQSGNLRDNSRLGGSMEAGNSEALVAGLAQEEASKAQDLLAKAELLKANLNTERKSKATPFAGLRFLKVPKDKVVLEENEKALISEIAKAKRRRANVAEGGSSMDQKSNRYFGTGNDAHVIDIIDKISSRADSMNGLRKKPFLPPPFQPFAESVYDKSHAMHYTRPEGKVIISLISQLSPQCKLGDLNKDQITCRKVSPDGHTEDTIHLSPNLGSYDRSHILPGLTPELHQSWQFWKKTPSGNTQFLGNFSKQNAVEVHILAPRNGYLQWHFPKGRQISLKLNLAMKATHGKGRCKTLPYAVKLLPITDENESPSYRWFGVHGEDTKGTFKGEHTISWTDDGFEAHVDAYEIRSSNESFTSCFKGVRFRAEYDKTQVCNGFSFVGGTFTVSVASASKSTRNLIDQPYLTVVDSCPTVHRAAILAAKTIQSGKKLSARLCHVLSQMQVVDSKLEAVVRRSCPHTKTTHLPPNNERLAVELLAQKHRLKMDAAAEEIQKLRGASEAHVKKSEKLKSLPDDKVE